MNLSLASSQGVMATTTTTLTQVGGADVCIAKTETFDVDFAAEILENKNISKDERDAVRRLFKGRTNGNQHLTLYKLGKDVKSDDIGRFVAVKGAGLQCLSRECRAALGHRYYVDVDIVNAQPTLLQHYAVKRGWVCDALKEYNTHRDEYLEAVMDLGLERWEAKQRITKIVFGGGAEGLTPFFVDTFAPEVRRLMNNVYHENKTLVPSVAKRGDRSMMALVLQTEERRCLMALDISLAKQGRALEVLIHDGGLVRKKDGETRLPDEIVRRCERDILEETGYSVRLEQKELKTTIQRTETNENDVDYEALKTQFEETGWKGRTTFYVRDQSAFLKVSTDLKDGILLKTKADLLNDEEGNLLPSGDSFVKRWLSDPNRKEYYKVDFLPKCPVPEHTYNLFHGFALPPLSGDITPFHEVLWMVSGKNQSVFDYIENWAAWTLQRPAQKTGICLIVKGLKGVGKDTYFDALGRIIGDRHFFTTAKPEFEVFGRFTSLLAQLTFLKFEEANFETNRDNEDKLKKLITSEYETIEHKGHDPIKTRSCVNMVMTTNKHTPIPMTDDERRFMMVEASADRRGDTEFWKRIHVALRDPAVLGAYHQHLLARDISTFTPTDVIRTEYYNDVLQTFAPFHARYFQRLLEQNSDRTEPFHWSARELYSSMKQQLPTGRTDLTEQRFGRDLKSYDGVITKTRKTRGNEYSADPVALESFLKQKGWWIDY